MNQINSWHSMPFSKYIELIKIKAEDDLEKSIQIVSILNDIPLEKVRNMKAKEFIAFTNNMEFLSHKPDFNNADKSAWKIKAIEDVTMDDFITFENSKTNEDSIPFILSFMSNKTEAEILKMSTLDVLNGFFLLQEYLKKYINRLPFLILMENSKMKMKKLKQKLQFWRKN
ncbi:hypothetical protein CHU00_18435 [Sphingobacterium cellulitidis]|uniref:hypothetical protein n=1 Tax=Sphingobacterium cellulitidis TaxID=1768011 RepID=UPI000B9442F3|nr:hypothetical protein [Sphingobacterium cellulitidis]OYD44145.1 hypothetical protein CHU00_18435 [Sphingobacterium cellulitidis]